jgi:hypothetical protein
VSLRRSISTTDMAGLAFGCSASTASGLKLTSSSSGSYILFISQPCASIRRIATLSAGARIECARVCGLPQCRISDFAAWPSCWVRRPTAHVSKMTPKTCVVRVAVRGGQSGSSRQQHRDAMAILRVARSVFGQQIFFVRSGCLSGRSRWLRGQKRGAPASCAAWTRTRAGNRDIGDAAQAGTATACGTLPAYKVCQSKATKPAVDRTDRSD